MTKTFSPALVLSLVALCVASPALAKDKKPVDPNKKTCRSEMPTGSLMAKSTCRLPAEWAQIDAANSAAAHNTLDRATRNGTPQ
ncbi:MAG: hypothetical protein ACRYFW_00575 [Janthinobacterium lividum]